MPHNGQDPFSSYYEALGIDPPQDRERDDDPLSFYKSVLDDVAGVEPPPDPPQATASVPPDPVDEPQDGLLSRVTAGIGSVISRIQSAREEREQRRAREEAQAFAQMQAAAQPPVDPEQQLAEGLKSTIMRGLMASDQLGIPAVPDQPPAIEDPVLVPPEQPVDPSTLLTGIQQPEPFFRGLVPERPGVQLQDTGPMATLPPEPPPTPELVVDPRNPREVELDAIMDARRAQADERQQEFLRGATGGNPMLEAVAGALQQTSAGQLPGMLGVAGRLPHRRALEAMGLVEEQPDEIRQLAIEQQERNMAEALGPAATVGEFGATVAAPVLEVLATGGLVRGLAGASRAPTMLQRAAQAVAGNRAAMLAAEEPSFILADIIEGRNPLGGAAIGLTAGGVGEALMDTLRNRRLSISQMARLTQTGALDDVTDRQWERFVDEFGHREDVRGLIEMARPDLAENLPSVELTDDVLDVLGDTEVAVRTQSGEVISSGTETLAPHGVLAARAPLGDPALEDGFLVRGEFVPREDFERQFPGLGESGALAAATRRQIRGGTDVSPSGPRGIDVDEPIDMDQALRDLEDLSDEAPRPPEQAELFGEVPPAPRPVEPEPAAPEPQIEVKLTGKSVTTAGIEDSSRFPDLERVLGDDFSGTFRGKRSDLEALAGELEDRADPTQGFEHTAGERASMRAAARRVRNAIEAADDVPQPPASPPPTASADDVARTLDEEPSEFVGREAGAGQGGFVNLGGARATTGPGAVSAPGIQRPGAERFLTAAGDIPEPVFRRRLQANHEFSALSETASQRVRDLRRAVRQAVGGGPRGLVLELADDDAVRQIRQDVHRAIKGQIDFDDLPEVVAPVARAMRADLDELASIMLDEGLVEGQLAKSVAENMGVYLHRGYDVWRKGNSWPEHVLASIKKDPQGKMARAANKVKAVLRSQYPKWGEDQVERELGRIIAASADNTRNPLSHLTSTGLEKDLSITKPRRGFVPQDMVDRIHQVAPAGMSRGEVDDAIQAIRDGDRSNPNIQRLLRELNASAKDTRVELDLMGGTVISTKRAQEAAKRQTRKQERVTGQKERRIEEAELEAGKTIEQADREALERIIGAEAAREIETAERVGERLTERAGEIEAGRVARAEESAARQAARINVREAARAERESLSDAARSLKEAREEVLKQIGERFEVSPEVRTLWGEQTDVNVSYVQSVAKAADYVARSRMLRDLAQLDGSILFRSQDEAMRVLGAQHGGEVVKVAGATAERWAPLIDEMGGEVWAERRWVEALEKQNEHFVPGAIYKNILRMNAWAKLTKTVGQFGTHVRNFVGGNMFMMAQGHVNLWDIAKYPAKLGRAVQTAAAGTGLTEFMARRAGKRVVDFIAGSTKTIEESRDLFRYYQNLGIVGGDAVVGDLRQAFRDADFSSFESFTDSAILRLTRRVAREASALYQAEDDVYRILAFESEMQRHVAAYDKAGVAVPDDIERLVADKVRNTYQTWELTPQWVQSLSSRNPVIGTFPSFTWQVFRTMAHTGRIMMEEMQDPVLRNIGIQRAAGVVQATMVGPGAVAWGMTAHGISRDDDEAMREFVAPWDKDATLVYTKALQGGEAQYINLSYTDPYSIPRDFAMALIRAADEGSPKDVAWAAGASAMRLLSPFIGTEILADALIEVKKNADEFGVPITRADPKLQTDQWLKDNFSHLARAAFAPGAINEGIRIAEAFGEKELSGGFQRTPVNEIAALAGIRRTDLSIPRSLSFKARDFGDKAANAEKILRDAFLSPEATTDEELVDAYIESERIRRDIFNDAHEVARLARRSGVSADRVSDIFMGVQGFSRDEARQIADGTYTYREINDRFLSNVTDDILADVQDPITRFDDAQEFNRRRNVLRQARARLVQEGR